MLSDASFVRDASHVRGFGELCKRVKEVQAGWLEHSAHPALKAVLVSACVIVDESTTRLESSVNA